MNVNSFNGISANRFRKESTENSNISPLLEDLSIVCLWIKLFLFRLRKNKIAAAGIWIRASIQKAYLVLLVYSLRPLKVEALVEFDPELRSSKLKHLYSVLLLISISKSEFKNGLTIRGVLKKHQKYEKCSFYFVPKEDLSLQQRLQHRKRNAWLVSNKIRYHCVIS